LALLHLNFFHIGVPLAAVGTAAHPFGRGIAAVLTGINGFNFCHSEVICLFSVNKSNGFGVKLYRPGLFRVFIH
jgi:hypothetical protein